MNIDNIYEKANNHKLYNDKLAQNIGKIFTRYIHQLRKYNNRGYKKVTIGGTPTGV